MRISLLQPHNFENLCLFLVVKFILVYSPISLLLCLPRLFLVPIPSTPTVVCTRTWVSSVTTNLSRKERTIRVRTELLGGTDIWALTVKIRWMFTTGYSSLMKWKYPNFRKHSHNLLIFIVNYHLNITYTSNKHTEKLRLR